MKNKVCQMLLASFMLVSAAKAVPILETASAVGGMTGGTPVDANHFVGWRFNVENPVLTQSLGASFVVLPASPPGFLGTRGGTVFAAIVALSGPSDLPDSFDLSTPDTLGHTILDIGTTPLVIADSSAALSLPLAPGWYAVLFGSGRFGATGDGVLAYHPLIDIDTFSTISSSGTPSWQEIEQPASFCSQSPPQCTLLGIRAFVEGQTIPEPSTFLLILLLAPSIFHRVRVRRA